MKLETILDALLTIRFIDCQKRERQYHAFRARILRMYAEKAMGLDCTIYIIEQMTERLAAKDARIKELEGNLKAVQELWEHGELRG